MGFDEADVEAAGGARAFVTKVGFAAIASEVVVFVVVVSFSTVFVVQGVSLFPVQRWRIVAINCAQKHWNSCINAFTPPSIFHTIFHHTTGHDTTRLHNTAQQHTTAQRRRMSLNRHHAGAHHTTHHRAALGAEEGELHEIASDDSVTSVRINVVVT